LLLLGHLSIFFGNNNWFFYHASENAEALAVQLSSGVNANNFSLFLHRKYRFSGL
jgi:hypothetical protein